ncbi:hypothetical protein RRG08_033091, partial [Elysia crispata]
FRLNPTARHTVWNLVFGCGTTLLALYVGNQAQVHRCLTCHTLREAKKALWICCPGYILFGVLSIIIGLYMSAFYENCDSLQAKLVDNSNQRARIAWGLPCWNLWWHSQFHVIRSELHVVLEDFIRVYLKSRIHKNKERRILQIISFVFGFIRLEITFLVSRFGSVLQASTSVFGIFSGPLLGLFSLGLFFPWVNEKGALGGLFGAIAITLGTTMLPTNPQEKSPLTCISSCNVQAFKNISKNAFLKPRTPVIPMKYDRFQLYGISYMWYSPSACIYCIIIGCIVSYFTGSLDPKDVDPRLIVPVLDDIFPFYYLPEHTKKYYRFGIDHEGVIRKFDKPLSSTNLESKEEVDLKLSKETEPELKFHSATFETAL